MSWHLQSVCHHIHYKNILHLDVNRELSVASWHGWQAYNVCQCGLELLLVICQSIRWRCCNLIHLHSDIFAELKFPAFSHCGNRRSRVPLGSKKTIKYWKCAGETIGGSDVSAASTGHDLAIESYSCRQDSWLMHSWYNPCHYQIIRLAIASDTFHVSLTRHFQCLRLFPWFAFGHVFW